MTSPRKGTETMREFGMASDFKKFEMTSPRKGTETNAFYITCLRDKRALFEMTSPRKGTETLERIGWWVVLEYCV